MENNNCSKRVESSKNIEKDQLIEKIKAENPKRFDQILIENEVRFNYFYVKPQIQAFKRSPLVFKFPLYDKVQDELDSLMNSSEKILKLDNNSIIEQLLNLGHTPLTNQEYNSIDLPFSDIHLEIENNQVLNKQPLYFLKEKSKVENCHDCKGEKYVQCSEIECRGQHIYDCSDCRSVGEIDCSDCRGNGEYTCPSCNGRGNLKCSACGGSGRDRKKDSVLAKCNSCNGSGERKCSSIDTSGNFVGLGLGNLASAAIKKGVGHEYCGGKGIIKCSTCNNLGKITCSKCTGKGNIECNVCYGDNQDNRYGKVDCNTCKTTGKIVTLSYFETTIVNISEDFCFSDGKEIEVEGFDVNMIKSHIDNSLIPSLTYLSLNGEINEKYNEFTLLAAKKASEKFNLFKDKYPKIIEENLCVDVVPCVTFSYHHILSGTTHEVSILSIEKDQKILFHSDPTDLANEKETIKVKVIELLNKAFSTKKYREKINLKNELFLIIQLAKVGSINEEEKRFIASNLKSLDAFTLKEKTELFKLMSDDTFEEINNKNALFFSEERAEEAKEKMLNLIELANTDLLKEEKEKFESISLKIDEALKSKPNKLSSFFKTWQISIPILLLIFSLIFFVIFFLNKESDVIVSNKPDIKEIKSNDDTKIVEDSIITDNNEKFDNHSKNDLNSITMIIAENDFIKIKDKLVKKDNPSQKKHIEWLNELTVSANQEDFFTEKCFRFVSDAMELYWGYSEDITNEIFNNRWADIYDVNFVEFGHLFENGNGGWINTQLANVDYLGYLNDGYWYELNIQCSNNDTDFVDLIRVVKIIEVNGSYKIDYFISLKDD